MNGKGKKEETAGTMKTMNSKPEKFKPGSFQSMNLEKDILSGVLKMGYREPTPVQRKALPVVLAGLDVVCMARTGSGKTCVFLLPMLQKLKTHKSDSDVRGLILSPTRELALQTFRFAEDMAKLTNLRIVSIFGGDSIQRQFDALASKPDILIATPGRLAHFLSEISTFKLKSIKYLVFDEADRLFEMGFAEQLHEIIKECPAERQTLLFSATLPKSIVQFSRAGLKDPQLIRLDTDVKMSEELRLAFFTIRSNEKLAALLYLIRKIIPSYSSTNQQTIIFTATRHHTELIHALLTKIEIGSVMIYGNMDQHLRTSNLKSFRCGEVSYLVVTDIAARGIDVPLLNNVINFQFPPAPKLFVHRCGRAARQGRIGFAFSLVEPEELPFMVDVHRFLGKEVETGSSSASLPSTASSSVDVEEGGSNNNKLHQTEEEDLSYNLSMMTPQMVHTGLLPQDVLDEENDFLKRLLLDDDNIATLYKISENGMKQYRRTRSEASHDGIKETKRLLKNEIIRSIHPLIKGCDPHRCRIEVQRKQDFIRLLQTFRPAATVFETGIGTGSTSQSGTGKSEKAKKSLEIAQAFRKTSKPFLERYKGKAAGTSDEEIKESEREMNQSDSNEENPVTHDAKENDDGSFASFDGDRNSLSYKDKSKPRISAKLHRSMKKLRSSPSSSSLPSFPLSDSSKQIKSDSTSSGFQDQRYYMSYGNENNVSAFAEETLQPLSSLKTGETFGATMMNKAMNEMNGDEIEDLRKKKLNRWDAKKGKFVKVVFYDVSVLFF
jgi:ATP-dependent RNA helicase DDX54/DBP10